MKTEKLYVELARAIGARLNCIAKGNQEWKGRHEDRIEELAKELPSGSGFDSGTKVDLDRSSGEVIVLTTAYHHMNENGFYDGWTEHVVKVVASLQFGFRLKISGPNRNGIKEMMYDEFNYALDAIAAVEREVA